MFIDEYILMDVPYMVKYQPRDIDDFQASTDVRDYIKVCVDTHDLNLLLIGDPGTGKTSLLNIIIRMYFGDAIGDRHVYDAHILFINSLREQGISFYRNDVKTFCQTQSVLPNRKKIVVLDDIDFINEQSQQVFRSCMDKYGDNVNFLISCINTQKVIESLQSRTTLVRLPLLTNEQLKTISSGIIRSESIDITDEAYEYLIKISNFSVRLITNYLEKIKILNRKVTLELAHEICSNINYRLFEDFTQHCRDGDVSAAGEVLFGLSDKGFSVMDILDSLTQYIKRADAIDEAARYALMPVICKYITIFHEIHEDDIELILLARDVAGVLRSAVGEGASM